MIDKDRWMNDHCPFVPDAWGLAWMYPWIKDTEFVSDGFNLLYNKTSWKRTKNGGLFFDSRGPAEWNAFVTSFYPILERQCIKERSRKTTGIYKYLENNYGRSTDIDYDGIKESYFYDFSAIHSIWVTANLVLSMVIEGQDLRNMYNQAFFKLHEHEPYLAHVEYPDIMVKKAVFDRDKNILLFSLIRGNPNLEGKTELVCKNIGNIKAITRNGKHFKNYKLENNVLIIAAYIKDNDEFTVALGSK